MTKKLYIFGNGLGRALNNEFYSLERALNLSWGNDGPLTNDQRSLIAGCLDNGVIESDILAPTKEAQLRDLQRVIDACDLIDSFQQRVDEGEGWLTNDGQNFPKAVRRYFHDAASRFHDAEMFLPHDFVETFLNFVRRERPHIATLNYDDLLYDAYVGTDISEEHLLRDGFFSDFDFERHKGFFDPKNEGWFLHLHGSPLFVTRGGKEKKIMRAQLGTYRGYEKTHLVLTHAKSKPGAIRSSPILSAYWKELHSILSAPTDVTIFGCSGEDEHLNQSLQRTEDHVKIRIVNREPENRRTAISEWQTRLKGKSLSEENFIFIDDVLNFDDW